MLLSGKTNHGQPRRAKIEAHQGNRLLWKQTKTADGTDCRTQGDSGTRRRYATSIYTGWSVVRGSLSQTTKWLGWSWGHLVVWLKPCAVGWFFFLHRKMFEVENAASNAELERNRSRSLVKVLENDIAALMEEKELTKEKYTREQ